MKFKSLFLTMLGAAAIVSCNNDAIDDNGNRNGNGEVVEGLPIYATLTFKLGNDVKTYAGTGEVNASPHERELKDAALYIYKSDASGMTPQCAVYLSSISSTASGTPANGDYNTVTLKTTSGNKKIFVAANVKTNPASQNMVNVTSLGVVSQTLTTQAAALNATLYSTATSFTTTAPTTPAYPAVGADGPADGLIKNFAMDDNFGDGNGVYSTGGTVNAAFMTNWDGPDDVAGNGTNINKGGASFTLVADVDSASSIPSGLGGTPTYDSNKNQLQIYVQRAYAKVSLKFGINATAVTAPTLPATLAAKYYSTADTAGGRFYPWGSGANAYWSLGNITTAELPFQQYVNGIVQDMFYQNLNDSIGHFDNWFMHYDNTRVFPFSAAINTYPHDNIKVTNTKSTMLNAGNYQTMTADNETTQASYKYAYATENARLNPVTQDYGTYAIIGGFYQPKNVLTSINRANVESNSPVLGYNGATLDGTEAAGSSKYGTPYSWVPTTPNDTLYYIADDRIFIHGLDNLMGYYAWASTQKKNSTAGDAWLAANPGGVITAAAVFNEGPGNGASFGSDVVTAINDDRDKDVLSAYFQGQCFYRIFIQNDGAASAAEKVVVLRNHIYDVKITSIKGPGIADPNNILNPGKPILDQDTYVSATINVLQWHKVEQGKDIDNE